MNWVLGHLLDYQITVLGLLGKESPFDASLLEKYRTGSDPITADGPGVISLEQLLDGHDRVHAAMLVRLGEMSDADFTREILWADRTSTLGWRFLFNNFHYSYHLGQLELLRQLAGKTEKLI